MKAIHFSAYGGPEVLTYGEFPEPELAPDQVLIEVHAVSVAPSDWLVRAGHLQHIFPQTFPTIPGRDGSGVVVEVGAAADFARVGDEVVFKVGHVELGSYAELIARPRDMVVAKPANVSHVEAASGGHAGTCAWIGLVREAQLGAKMKVLIHGGAGAIGGLSLQLAKHLGATPIITTCRAANVDYVRSIGANVAIAYDEEDFRDHVQNCAVVFDLVGGVVHDRSYAVLKPGGVMTWLIAEPFESRASKFDMVERQAVIDDDPAALQAVMELLGAGALKPQVVKVMPLAAAAEAQALLEAGAVSRGRIVLEVR
jgi:NADPH:quinone reductase-like Zn-dependent oxidoreductase